jgi:hypothetical protein
MFKRALRRSATRSRAWAVPAAILASVVGIFLVPSSAMATENFCYTTLAPYGQGGDRCWGSMQYMYGINLVTYERAGCVDVANGSNELLQSWTCIGNSNVAEFHYEPTIRRKAVARNNNLTNSGFFSASEFW